jgi:C-terminal processing protease CtpA/Prc
VKISFAQSELSKALAERSRKIAAEQLQKQEQEKLEVIEARKQAEKDRYTCVLETAETFSRTFECARTGMCLGDGGGKGKTFVSKCLPGSAALKAGIPKGAVITAINCKSVEFRRFKEVKKLVQIATRPVTIDYSTEETPTFPRTERKPREGVPSYALKPT